MRRRRSLAKSASRPPRTCRPSSTTSKTPSSRSMTAATSSPSIPPASASSAIRWPRSSAARSDCLLPDVDAAHPCDYLERWPPRSTTPMSTWPRHQTWGLAKDGSRVAIEVARQQGQAQLADGYIVCIRDITERHLAEQVHARKRGRYRTLVEHAPEAIVVFDVDGGQHRRRQRQRLPLLQDEPRGAAGQRAGQDQPPDASGRHALLRRVARLHRKRAGRRGAGVRVAALRLAPVTISPARCATCACRAPTGA